MGSYKSGCKSPNMGLPSFEQGLGLGLQGCGA